MHKIAAVVVTYNRKVLLKKCIQHILNQTAQGVDIIVIDNASTDGTGHMIQNEFSGCKQVIYQNTGSNLGGAGGFSFGIRWAVEHAYEYLWIMDDDTIPEERALEELLKADEILDGKYGFLSSYAKWVDGSPCEMNVPRLDLGWRQDIAGQFDNQMIRLEAASFVSLFMKAEAVKKVGLPIKEFFIWADDVEYTKRISKRYPCFFVYKSQVTHEMGSNKATTIIDTDEERLGRFDLLYRNRYYIAKHGAKRDVILYWLEIKNTIRDIKNSNCKNKGKRIRIVLRSVWKGLRFKPQIEYVDGD
uniref:glycosyltransferase family 2 protein n=1 Tax=Agathobacter sp. TaxID=2021311 RepID=UPI0040573F68